MVSEAGANPIFSAADPLAALTENLDQHIVAEAFKPRAAAPWEVNTFEPPTTIPEEESFTFADRETLHRRQSSRLPSQVVDGGSHLGRITPSFLAQGHLFQGRKLQCLRREKLGKKKDTNLEKAGCTRLRHN